MLILNVIDNDLACDCGVCRVFIMTYHRFCNDFIPKNGLYYLVYYIWYIAFIESYYILCLKKTIDHIYRIMCVLIGKLFEMAYLSVQNILFYINNA